MGYTASIDLQKFWGVHVLCYMLHQKKLFYLVKCLYIAEGELKIITAKEGKIMKGFDKF